MMGPAGARPIGRYLLFDEIASGATATVHFGRLSGASGFGRTVAIKRLRPEYAGDPECAQMFLDEARLAARIHHPNVVPTLDVVQEGEELVLVMEYVHGESLASLMSAARSAKSKTNVRVVAAVMSGVLHGLHAAHEASDEQGQPLGIVHRDVAPQNILVGADGVPRVLDFGVAKMVAHVQTRRQGQLKGRLQYMAPERLQHKSATRQSDVYAAAVVMWELLTGQALFANSQAAIVTAVLKAPIKAPSELADHVPAELDRIVLRGLDPDATRRYQTALEMAVDLEKCAGVASAAEVGEWVESLVHDELAQRAERIAEIEQAPGSTPAPSATRGTVENPVTITPSAAPHRPKMRPTSATAWIGGGVSLLALSAALVLWRVAEKRDAPSEGGSSNSAGAAASPSASDTSSTAAVSADTSMPSPPGVPPATSSATSSGATSPLRLPRRRTPPPAQRPNCDPPYTIDEQGHTKYKPNCF
jgi:eukaryotic-like serine/threonine-protein kinase